MADYQQKLAAWKASSGVQNPDGISSSEVTQALTLGREPQAKVTVSNLAGTKGNIDTSKEYNTDSISYEYRFNGSIPGTALVATYTNLHNSYYYDDNGNKHLISKIVRTFSNLTKQPWVSSWNWNSSPENNGNPLIWIYDDPADGFWYYFSSGVTVTDQYYDEQGNPISFGNNAWLAISSLNNENRDKNGNPLNNTHVERVEALLGAKAFSLRGSSVSNHDGILYADTNNTHGSGLNNGEWDTRNSPNIYYGSGLMKLSGNSVSLRFSTTFNGFDGRDTWQVWAITSTIIPSTPGPNKPTQKTSSINYHYDTKSVKILMPEVLIYGHFRHYLHVL